MILNSYSPWNKREAEHKGEPTDIVVELIPPFSTFSKVNWDHNSKTPNVAATAMIESPLANIQTEK